MTEFIFDISLSEHINNADDTQTRKEMLKNGEVNFHSIDFCTVVNSGQFEILSKKLVIWIDFVYVFFVMLKFWKFLFKIELTEDFRQFFVIYLYEDGIFNSVKKKKLP